MSALLLVAIAIGTAQTAPAKPVEVAFKQVDSGGFSRQRTQRVFVIRSGDDFSAYLATTGRRITRPKIDWTTNELIAIHIGPAPSTGFGVTVKRVLTTGPHAVSIEIVKSTPPPGTMQAMHVTYPFVLISIARMAPKTTYRLSAVTQD